MRHFVSRASAKRIVVDQLADLARAAGWTFWIATKLDRTEGHCHRIDRQQLTDESIADSKQQLDRFCRLNRTDEPGHDAEYPAFGAARHELPGRRLAEKAPVAGSTGRPKHRRLPLEAVDAAVDIGNTQQDRRVVNEISRRKVIRAIDDHVEAARNLQRIHGSEPCFVSLYPNVGIDVAQAIARRIDF